MSRMSIPWTPGLGLHCPACDWSGPPDLHPMGCPDCGHPLETTYPADAPWRLPLPAGSLTDLGRTVTPLVSVPDDPGHAPEARVAEPDRLAQGPVPHDLRGARPRCRRAGRVHHVHRQPRRLVRGARGAGKASPCVVLSTSALRHPLAVAAQRTRSGDRPPRPGRTAPRRRGADRPRLVRGDLERSAPGGRVDAVRHRRLPPRGRRDRRVARPAARRGQRAVRRRRHPRRPPPRARRRRGPGRRRDP